MFRKPALISTEYQNGSLKFWKVLRYRFSAWLIAKGLSFFIKETIVPIKYCIKVDHDQNLLLSHVFASDVLRRELVDYTDSGLSYLNQHKVVSITVGNPLFSLYIHLTRCLANLYGDATPLVVLNDAIFVRGIASFYEDLVQGNLPIINELPAEEAAAMKRVREFMETEANRQIQVAEKKMKETKDVVN